ncbi:MAG: HlyD family efflux transporter periplasmic adaptor subunit [Pseudomonadota bacterium]
MSESMPHQYEFTTLASIDLPSTSKVVGQLMVLLFLLVALFMILVPWQQTTSGIGRVTAINPNDRQQEINALVSGRIQEWYVQDGMQVKAGDPIVRIVDNDPLLLQRLEAEREQVTAKYEAAEAAVNTAEIDLRRVRDLLNDGLESRRSFEQAQIKVQSLRADVANAAAELSRIDINISRQSVQTVVAPRDGVILSVNAGDASTFISAGSPVATFVPDNVDRAVEIFVNGMDVALLERGDLARLQFEGWPAVQFSGWPSVAIGTFGGTVASVDASAMPNGLFRVLIVPDPQDANPWPSDKFVRFGAKVRGWVLLEEVTVGYEVWRQLNSFPPDFPADASLGSN